MGNETRERILDGTLELLAATTLTDFSMDRLADWIGLSRKTIYNHFSGKAELVSAAIAAGDGPDRTRPLNDRHRRFPCVC